MLVLNADTGVSMVQDNTVNPVTDVASGIPCFSAYRNTTQTITANVLTKLQFNVVEFDTTNSYDETTNYRFQPLVAGYYQCSLIISIPSVTPTDTVACVILKNGINVLSGSTSNPYSANYGVSTTSGVIYLNGTTDYIEGHAQANITSIGTPTAGQNKFQSHLIVGA